MLSRDKFWNVFLSRMTTEMIHAGVWPFTEVGWPQLQNLREDPDFVFPSHSKSLQLREDYLWRWFSHSQFRRTGFAAISSLGVFSSPSTSWDHNGVSSCGQRCSEKGLWNWKLPCFWLPGPFLWAFSKAKVGFYCWSLAAAVTFPTATSWGDRWLVLAGTVLFCAWKHSDLSCVLVCREAGY